MLSLLVITLATLTALAGLGDFIIGKRGDKAIRERIYEFYFAIEGNWRRCYQIPAQLLAQFQQQILHTDGRLSYTKIVLINISLNILLLIVAYVSDANRRSNIEILLYDIQAIYLSISGVIPEIASWILLSKFMDRMSIHDARQTSLYVIGLFLVWYILYCIHLIIFYTILHIHVIYVLRVDGANWELFREVASKVIMLPVLIFMYQNNSSEFSAQHTYLLNIGAITAIPIITLAISTLIGLILYMFRPILHRPIAGLLTRIEATEKPILTVATIFFSAATVLFATWAEFLS